MPTNTIDSDVTLGQWNTEMTGIPDSSRICTYADLVRKTLPYSSEVLHELDAENNQDSVYVYNGRKTLTYQDLSHCNGIKVYLKSSISTPDASRHMYRFDGTLGNLSRFSCDENTPNNDDYLYNQCVVVSDIETQLTPKQLRFRFRNITTSWNIMLEPVEGDESYCSSVNIIRYADLIDPHDVYMEMLNGRKAKFHFSQLMDTDGIVVYNYYERKQYYPGLMSEYDPSYDGDVSVNYTNFDKTNSFDCFDDERFVNDSWRTRTFEVEPYNGSGYVEMKGRRNTPVFVTLFTDGHVTLRNIPDSDIENVQEAGYAHITEYGTTLIAPPDTVGYAQSTVEQPYFMLVSLQSQDLAQWDRWKAVIKKYNADGTEQGNPYEKETTIFNTDGGYLLSVSEIEQDNKLKSGYTYSVQVECIPTFHPTLVRVTDYTNLEVKYMPDNNPINEDVKVQSGTKWIHSFYTRELTTLEAQHIHIQVKVISESAGGHPETIGPNTDNAIAKISLSANRQPKVNGFVKEGEDTLARVPYEYNLSSMPPVLDLYLRLLPKITVTFYSSDNGWQVWVGESGVYTLTDAGVTLTFDAEDISVSMLTFNLKRNGSSNNMMSGVFYYNATGTGTPGYGVSFTNLSTPFDQNSSRQVSITSVSFSSTTFSVRFTSSKQMYITMKWYLPRFVDVYSLQTKDSELNVGPYLGTKITAYAPDNANFNIPSIIVLQNGASFYANSGDRTSELYSDSDDTSLPGKMLVETFLVRTTGTMLLYMKRKTTYAGSLSSGYLLTRLLKEVQFALSGGVQIISGSTFQLTNDSYNDVNLTNVALLFSITSGSSSSDEGIIKIVPKPFEDLQTSNSSLIFIEVADQTLPDGTGTYKAWLQPMYISPSGYIFTPGESSALFANFYLQSTSGNKHTYVLNVPSNWMTPSNWMSPPYRYWKFRFQQQNASDPSQPTKYLWEFDYVLHRDSASGTTIDQGSDIPNDTGVTPNINVYSNAASNRKLYLVVTPKIIDVMSIAGIHYWIGSDDDYYGAMTLDTAYMPPIIKTATGTQEPYTLLMYLSFKRPNELNLDSTVQITLPNIYASQIQLDKDTTGGTIRTDVGNQTFNNHWDLLVKAKVTTDLSAYNNSRVWPSGSQTPQYDKAVYYTGMPVPFHLKVSKKTGGYLELDVPVKLGPVMNIFVDNTQGGELKPHTDETHLVRARGREWYLNSDGSIRDHAGYYGTVGGYKYNAKFIYNGREIPNNTSISDPIKSRRTGYGFDITAPTTWTEGSTVHTDDWGAWQMKVADEDQLPAASGTMVINMEITKGSSQIEMYNWYPAKQISVVVRDFMSVGIVSWWNGSSYQSSALKKSFLSPVSRGDTAVATTTLTFPSDHRLNLNNATILVPGPISATTSVSGTNILNVTIKVSIDLGIYNDLNPSSRIFYTGMKVPFNVKIGTFSDIFYMTLGPVLAFAHEVANGRFADYQDYPYGETFGGSLKPENGQKIVLQSRAHEWYKDDSGNIAMTSNSAVGESALNNRIIRGRQYNIEWKYNNVSMTETAAGSRPSVDSAELVGSEAVYQYTREFRDVGNHLRVQHAASWTGLNSTGVLGADGRYYKDGGAWRVYVENATGLTSGTLKANVTVSDTTSDPPEIKLQHWYDGGKETSLSVSNVYTIIGAREWIGNVGGTVQWRNYDATLTDLEIAAKRPTTNDSNLEIFIQAPDGGSFLFDLQTVDPVSGRDMSGEFTCDIIFPAGGGTWTPPGSSTSLHYDGIAYLEIESDLMTIYNSYNIYSGMELVIKLSGSNVSSSSSDNITVKLGRFGYVVNGAPSQMSGDAGSTLKFDAYARIIQSGGSQQTIPVDGNVVCEYLNYSGGATSTNVSVTHPSSDMGTKAQVTVNSTLSMPASLGYNVYINEPWNIPSDGAHTIDFKIERYLNFYSTTGQAQGMSFVIAPQYYDTLYLSTQEVGTVGYVANMNNHCAKNGITYYYCTLKVEIGSDGKKRFKQVNEGGGNDTSIGYVVGSYSPSLFHEIKFLKEEPTSTEIHDLQVAGYNYVNGTTIYVNSGLTTGYSMYAYTKLTSSTDDKFTVYWDLASSISSNQLDTVPFWDPSYVPN